MAVVKRLAILARRIESRKFQARSAEFSQPTRESRLKRLSGRDIVAILRRFGFEVVSQRASHIKLQHIGPGGDRETLTISDHRELDTGACGAIPRQAGRYIPVTELEPFFHSE
jgi:predicted RNA binding protein YcfA (HicA-like mRNA interferase family)